MLSPVKFFCHVLTLQKCFRRIFHFGQECFVWNHYNINFAFSSLEGCNTRQDFCSDVLLYTYTQTKAVLKIAGSQSTILHPWKVPQTSDNEPDLGSFRRLGRCCLSRRTLKPSSLAYWQVSKLALLTSEQTV